jgi:uncharacterized membrane protein
MTLTASRETYRIRSIDLLRGIVMVIMALDHTRDFLHNDAMAHDPLDLSTTNPFLFFTRFITHYCAPTFVFLSGISAYLSGLKKSKAEQGSFLIKRGCWLIFVEIAIISLGFSFDPLYHFFLLQVIWAIGISMILLGLMIRLPYSILLTVGLAICFGHNILDIFERTGLGTNNILYSLLHRPNVMPLGENRVAFIAYPFLPWTGLMLVGYCFGRLFEKRFEASRKKLLLLIGTALIVLFVTLRFANFYGDPNRWTTQPSPIFTFLSFLNVTKYPPSLLYMCITLGPSILFLALFEQTSNTLTRVFTVYGRVPFFYYVLHFYLIHFVCVIVFFASGFSTKDIINPGVPFLFRPPALGFSLPVVYLFWFGIVLALYLPCRWFNSYKATHSQWWLSYL